jgi:hypothetical protein
MTEIFIQLKKAIVIIEAEQDAAEVVSRLQSDGYDAKKVGDGMVLVKERLKQ